MQCWSTYVRMYVCVMLSSSEKDAYSLILGEIHRQSKSITLPSQKAPAIV